MRSAIDSSNKPASRWVGSFWIRTSDCFSESARVIVKANGDRRKSDGDRQDETSNRLTNGMGLIYYFKGALIMSRCALAECDPLIASKSFCIIRCLLRLISLKRNFWSFRSFETFKLKALDALAAVVLRPLSAESNRLRIAFSESPLEGHL